MPVSPRQRESWAENMSQLAHDLTLYSGNTSLETALSVTPSAARQFFESESFKRWKQAKEDEINLLAGVNERLNAVIAGVNNVTKAASRR